MRTLSVRGRRFLIRRLLMFYRTWISRRVRNTSIVNPQLIHSSAYFSNSRIMGVVNVDARANIFNSVINSTSHGTVEIGDHCGLRDVKILGATSIGRRTSLNGPLRILSFLSPVRIGKFSSIAWYVTIQEFNHRIDQCATLSISAHILREDKKRDLYTKGPVQIGNDVWIGAQTTIVSGATISDGAVIGANSVVTGFIPPYAVAAGSPARVIKYRFDVEIIDRLLELAWWDWDDEKIERNRNLFKGPLTLDKISCIVA